MIRTSHYWQIHAKVCKRLWTDLPRQTREIIADDNLSGAAVWFANKVHADTLRLYEDPEYYLNQKERFTYPV
jgi:hypothetical protein